MRLLPVGAHGIQPEALKWTDANALMAKWLFLARSHIMWGKVSNPLGRAPRNAPELAQCVGVSNQTAYTFIDTFTRSGLIEVRRGGVDIPDSEAFAEAWLDAARHQIGSWNRYPVQWHGGPLQSRDQLLHLCEQLTVTNGTLIPGGFAAAELQGWLHLRNYPLPMFHWHQGNDLLAEWMSAHRVYPLPPADARDAHFWIVESPWPRSVEKISAPWSQGPGHAPVCRIADPLQIAMDCVGSPRGEEQARDLLDRMVLGRNFDARWQ